MSADEPRDQIECDVVVVGAGIVGLAVARALADAGRTVVVLEAARRIGSGLSSRNSEVVHSGLYYPRGSLKARLCVEGREALYAYCATRGVAHRRCGKLVVACAPDDVAALATLLEAGRINGVDDLTLLEPDAVKALEPALATCGALLSPSTGIVDSHAMMMSLQADIEAAGGAIALGTPVTRGDVGDGLVLWTGGREPTRIRARTLVNATALEAPRLADTLTGFPKRFIPTVIFAKGNYFAYSGPPPFSRLVYPVPEIGGLGVHATLDLGGRIRFGPDVEWVERSDESDVDPNRADAFYAAIRRYWPALPDGSLRPDYAGIRPKLSGPGQPAADFLIQDNTVHGIDGLVNLFGIESPGLTAALAIGASVAAMLGR